MIWAVRNASGCGADHRARPNESYKSTNAGYRAINGVLLGFTRVEAYRRQAGRQWPSFMGGCQQADSLEGAKHGEADNKRWVAVLHEG